MALVPSLSVLLFHTLRWRAKAPWEQPPRGPNIYQHGLITKAERQRPFPSVTLQKTASFFLDFRAQPQWTIEFLPMWELPISRQKSALKTNWWKRGFETALWNSRLVVLFAVVTSVLAGLDLFFVIGLESFRVLLNLVRSADLAMVVDQREAILRESILRMISLIDGYLLGAFMFIFGFGMYELFLADIQEARSSPASGRILHIKSLEDLKTRLGKVILIILIDRKSVV